MSGAAANNPSLSAKRLERIYWPSCARIPERDLWVEGMMLGRLQRGPDCPDSLLVQGIDLEGSLIPVLIFAPPNAG